MPEDVFAALEQELESGNPFTSFDLLIGQFRAAKDYHSLFEALLMRKRLQLGLPLFLTNDLSALPSEIRDAYSKAVADAARYVKTLRESGQLAAAGEQQLASGPTHQIERDEQGRQVLRRKRFSIR